MDVEEDLELSGLERLRTKLDRMDLGKLLIRHPQFRGKCPFLTVSKE